MQKFIITVWIAACAANAYGGQTQDLLGGASLPLTNPKASTMRNDYDVDMGQIIHAFDFGESESGDTVLRRSWSPDNSIAVRLRKNVGTLISIPDGERIQGFVLGDQEGFVPKLLGEKMPNKIVISPTAYDIDTNLTLIDEHNRIYTFYLRSDPKESDIVPHFTVMVELPGGGGDMSGAAVKWHGVSWPDDNPEAKGKAAELLKAKSLANKLSSKEYDFLEKQATSSEVNADYSIYGDSSIAPHAVWDDGKQVYISFRDGTPSSRLPGLYRIIDGYAAIANSHYRDGFLITDGVSEEGWMLIDGQKTVCIKAPPPRKVAQKKAKTVARSNREVKTSKIRKLTLAEKAAAMLGRGDKETN